LTKIYEYTNAVKWKFVVSKENAADPGSRGLSPNELRSSNLWFHGPDFLKSPESAWPVFLEHPFESLEERPVRCHVANFQTNLETHIEHFSSFNLAIRTTGWIFRFYSISRKKDLANKSNYLSHAELQHAKTTLIILSQKQKLPDEYAALEKKESVSEKSILKSLNPFMDEHGVIRMNGRLSNLELPYSQKFPILITADAWLTTIVLQDIHRITLHGNVSLMLNILRKQFWIPRVKSTIRKIIHNCKTCFLEKKETLSQLMGPLPIERITISRPFTRIAIDFAGPITLKAYKGRCKTFLKGYICIFVCFATKAIHLEAVSSYDGPGFLNAFRRFYSRRGLPSYVFLDNAGNHIAVANYFNREAKRAIDKAVKFTANLYADRKIEWEFNTPLASHRAGLVEAGVKSCKYHLRRVLGNILVTFEEFNTILVEIEGCLNSRPLVALNENSTELNALTPGHFLIGDALLVPPEPSNEVENLSDLRRLDLLTKLKVDFWSRWKNEYLHTLQSRVKWRFPQENIKVGELVVIKNIHTSPHTWPLGRVVELKKSTGGHVRICVVKTATGLYERPITKLVLLPFQRTKN
jgi:hypothetical protein